MANRLSLKVNMPSDAELSAMFDAVPILVRHRVGDATVKAGSKIVVDRAKQLAPRSVNSGSTRKWSKKMYIDGGTGGTARSKTETPLWKTIKRVVRRYSANALAVVGPEWGDGNKVFFNASLRGRRVFLWGKDAGRIATVRNWIAQAFDQTKPQQLAAMKNALQQKMRDIWE